jgi:hypothetical protein
MKLMRAAVVAPSEGRQRTLRLVRTGALLAVTLLAGAAVPALATGALASKTFDACVTTKTGTIKIVSKSSACAAGQHKISWNNVGPRGARGLAGQKGNTGARGPAGVVTGYQDTNSGVAVQYIASTTVATLHVPSGNYIVDAAVTLSNPPGATDNVYCTLTDDTSDGTGGDVAVPPGSSQVIPLTMAGNGAKTFQIACDDDQGTATAGASITAIPTKANIKTTG